MRAPCIRPRGNRAKNAVEIARRAAAVIEQSFLQKRNKIGVVSYSETASFFNCRIIDIWIELGNKCFNFSSLRDIFNIYIRVCA